MRVTLVTDPSTAGWPNEDFATVAPDVAVLVDGAGSPGGRATGCVHGVAWYARTLGGLLAGGARDLAQPLAEVLRGAIAQVAQLHAGTCDLRHPGTPSSTVIVARRSDAVLEYLILADSILLLQPRDGEPRRITDTRLDEIASAQRPDYSLFPARSAELEAAKESFLSLLDRLRNQPGGYWTASSDPAAADQAITSTVPAAELAAVALLSDGVGRLADRYRQATWPQIATTLAEHGPAEVIRQLREVEASDPDGHRWPRSKIRDDATAVYWPMS